MKPSYFSDDVQSFLACLSNQDVNYLIVGGEAVIFYGNPRLTGDIDIFYEASENNIERLFEALIEFWSGDIPGIDKKEELAEKGIIIQFGVPPNRIDLINCMDGVEFRDAWKNKTTTMMTIRSKQVAIHYIGLQDLIRNKALIRRPKDLEDLKFLKKIQVISASPTFGGNKKESMNSEKRRTGETK